MATLLAFVVGGLFAAGIYLLLRRSVTQMIMGISLLTNAVNLMIFTVGGLTRGDPPLIPAGSDGPNGVYANPVPQALILTAIVIGFGVLAFALVLAYRAKQAVGSDDPDGLRSSERIGPPLDTN